MDTEHSLVRYGFSAVELLLVMGMVAILGGLSIPAYREYQIRSDLGIAAEHITQALARARTLSVTGGQDGMWGVYAPSGVVFKGQTYGTRDQQFDEVYPISLMIGVTGLTQVTFSRLTGQPSATGTIVLTALNGAQRRIDILLSRQGIPTTVEDRLTVCHCAAHSGHTLRLPDAAWPAHERHGDHMGVCTGLPGEC